MTRSSLNRAISPLRSNGSASTHRRSLSAPVIQVEDLGHSLTSIEHSDEDEDLGVPTLLKSHTSGVHGAGRGVHARKRRASQLVDWQEQWNHEHNPFEDGRVLIIDLLTREQTQDKKRQTKARELKSERELHHFYEKGASKEIKPCLRIIHVQNSSWGRKFFIEKYGIGILDTSGVNDPSHAFWRWARHGLPQQRAGRPVLNAKAFDIDKVAHRNIWCTGFGIDYLRYFKPKHMSSSLNSRIKQVDIDAFKLLELNKWVEDQNSNSYSTHGYDVYAQRLSMYVQRNMEGAGLVNEDWRTSESHTYAPRDSEELNRADRLQQADQVDTQTQTKMKRCQSDSSHRLDNGTTLIVFETSHSGLARDTLIEARAEIEKKWRRIYTDLPRMDISTDSLLALQCLDFSIDYIMQALVGSWEKLLSRCEEHVDILQEKVYESPADESRAPELWANQSNWLKIEKLQFVQLGAVNALRKCLNELAVGQKDFLEEAPDRLKAIETLINEELTKPTANLNDLVYKSVAIRDSRQGLRLGTSMWRLSWITFIFLPLTFISGFFGMNVDIFQPQGNFPSIKWYVITAVPLMILVFAGYYVLKNTLSVLRDDPLRRGAFEDIYSQFSQQTPHLWSRNGPRSYVQPQGLFSKLKWRLICYWFAPSRTISAQPLSDLNNMGFLSKVKHYFAIRWLKTIKVDPHDELSMAELGPESSDNPAARLRLLEIDSPMAIVSPESHVVTEILSFDSQTQQTTTTRQHRSSIGSSQAGSRRRSILRSVSPAAQDDRSGSPSSGGMVCEEEDPSLDQSDVEDPVKEILDKRLECRSRYQDLSTDESTATHLAIPQANHRAPAKPAR